MRDRLVELVQLCRKNGLRVSTAELLDALSAVELVGIEDPATLKAALATTLVKRSADAEVFDELFELFFFRRSAFRDAGDDALPLVEQLRQLALTDDQLEALLAILADEAARMSPLMRSGLGMSKARVEALIRLAGIQLDFERLQNPLQVGFFTQQLLEQMQVRHVTEELRNLEREVARKLGAEIAAKVMQAAHAQLEQLRRQVRGYVKDEFERRNVQFTEQMREQILAHKAFGALSEQELKHLRLEVTRLAQRLRERMRPKRSRRAGRFDARRTLRRALASGGVPFRLLYKRRRRERPSLVVLCDISDSVRHVSRFMLQLAYTLQEHFAAVRSFVFVSDIGEATQLFRQYELHEAVNVAYGGGVVNVYANSNFGRAFAQFAREHLEAVSSRTTVIIIGDGRNNYNPTESWALDDIRQRARRILWLNPEPPASWAFGDSVMREYEPFCERVESVTNLASLARAVDRMIF